MPGPRAKERLDTYKKRNKLPDPSKDKIFTDFYQIFMESQLQRGIRWVLFQPEPDTTFSLTIGELGGEGRIWLGDRMTRDYGKLAEAIAKSGIPLVNLGKTMQRIELRPTAIR